MDVRTTTKIKDKILDVNWNVVALVIIFSYGFLLANQSIGIDDENFDFYFKNNGIVASGRWGSWLIKRVLNSYSYLPVWRDFFAVLILLCASIFFIWTYEYVAEKKLDKIISTIGVSAIVSYPIVAKMYIYIDNSVETAMCILLAMLAYVSLVYPYNRKKVRVMRSVIAILCLTLGCSLIENTLVYFCVEVCLFALVKKKENNIVYDIIWPVFLCIIAAIITKILAYMIAYAINFPFSDYGSASYFMWSRFTSFQDLVESIRLLKNNYQYYFNRYVSIKFFTVSCIWWIGVAIYQIVKRKYEKSIYALGIIVTSFAMYIITGNGGLPLRIFTSYYISVVGAWMYIYIILEDFKRPQLKGTLQNIFLICSFLMIFYMTKETNEYYQLDYKRYLRDVDVARTINYDLEKEIGVTPNVPVVFIGQPKQYGDINTEGEIALNTIYSNNYDGESIRIHRFFDMLGYEYPDVFDEEITMLNYGDRSNNELIKKAKEISGEMAEYPYEGYIKILDDMIIINLGDGQ